MVRSGPIPPFSSSRLNKFKNNSQQLFKEWQSMNWNNMNKALWIYLRTKLKSNAMLRSITFHLISVANTFVWTEVNTRRFSNHHLLSTKKELSLEFSDRSGAKRKDIQVSLIGEPSTNRLKMINKVKMLVKWPFKLIIRVKPKNVCGARLQRSRHM